MDAGLEAPPPTLEPNRKTDAISDPPVDDQRNGAD
jgi:hypothetical protein